MGTRSRLTGLIVVAAMGAAVVGILWPVAGTASQARLVGSGTYTDPTGDTTGDGPDVTGIDVSDDSAGKISFTVTIANRPSLTDSDAVQAYFDTDKSSSTGGSGFDYEVGWIQGHQVFMHWDGSQFAEAKPGSFSGSYKDGKATFTIAKDDFGGSTSFFFIVTTTGDTGDSTADRAPDGSATFDYPPTSGAPPPPPAPPPPGSPQPPPKPGTKSPLKVVKPRLAPAVAGRSFTVPMVVTDAKTKKGVRGKLTCQAKLNGKTFRASRHATAASGKATCTWKLPSTSSNEILRGTITETYKGATAKRTFSTRIL